jgi:hypothetical protein
MLAPKNKEGNANCSESGWLTVAFGPVSAIHPLNIDWRISPRTENDETHHGNLRCRVSIRLLIAASAIAILAKRLRAPYTVAIWAFSWKSP